MTTTTVSPDLQDLLTVMDTLEIFQDADRDALDPSEVRRRVRTVYASQDLPLDERALHQAVELYLHPYGAPVPAVVAPPVTQAPAVPVVPAVQAVAVEPLPRSGLGLLEMILVMGMVAMISIAAFVVYPTVKHSASTNEMTAAITTAVTHPLDQAKADLQTPEAQRAFAQEGIAAHVDDNGQGGTQVTLNHVPIDTAWRMVQAMAQADPQAARDRRGHLQSAAQIPGDLRLNRVHMERLADVQAMAATCDQHGIACPSDQNLTLTLALHEAPQ